jgi:hypothetical protein
MQEAVAGGKYRRCMPPLLQEAVAVVSASFALGLCCCGLCLAVPHAAWGGGYGVEGMGSRVCVL